MPTVQGSDNPMTEPIPVLNRRPPGRESFSALGVYNYRLYALAQLFANTGA